MKEIVGIRFKNSNRVHYYASDGVKYDADQKVIAETSRGLEMGEVATATRQVADEKVPNPLPAVTRKATEMDIKRDIENAKREEEALRICAEKVAQHGLEMKLVRAQYAFDRSKIIFYFTADGRVDFRELVKTLASAFKKRIELRQIGVRDEAKILGGMGICGRKLCCCSFPSDFEPVSIKMAKEQGLSLNPTKISGCCGRLMCCLKYEQPTYEESLRKIPKPGAIVKTADGRGVVVNIHALKGVVMVKLDKKDEPPKQYAADDVKTIKDAEVRLTKEEMNELKNLE